MGSLAYMLECATSSKLPNTEHTKVNTVISKKCGIARRIFRCWYIVNSFATVKP